MKGIFISYFFLVLALTNLSAIYAQSKSTLDMLVDKEWMIQFPSNDHPRQGFVFTTMQQIDFLVYRGERIEKFNPFYLSDICETKFDSLKVGKSKEGKFIVVNSNVREGANSSWHRVINNYVIVSLTGDSLVIRTSNNSVIIFKCD